MAFGNLDGFDLAIINLLSIANLAMWFIGTDEVYIYRCAIVAAMIGYIVAASRTRKD